MLSVHFYILLKARRVGHGLVDRQQIKFKSAINVLSTQLPCNGNYLVVAYH